jgi:hypothetical protein
MHTASAVLSWALAAASEPATFTVDRVDAERSAESVQLIAYDPDGEPVGEVVLWADVTGRARLDANFADGLYLSVVPDGDAATIETNNGEQVAARMLEIQGVLSETADADWKKCVGSIALTIPACLVHPVLCAGEMYFAACHCGPLLSEFEGQEC